MAASASPGWGRGSYRSRRRRLRERLIGLKPQRDERARNVADLQRRLSTGEPQISAARIDRLSLKLRGKLHHGEPEIRRAYARLVQAYARLMIDEMTVSDEENCISGSKAVLARPKRFELLTPRFVVCGHFSSRGIIGDREALNILTLQRYPQIFAITREHWASRVCFPDASHVLPRAI